ncbi:hypothetical protein AB4Z29_00270 [Paenibacillus sp. 2TAB23]|uniref:hypothetical protein n=1 Tax=Paenibacillus sp. 2TAB23 TaxID=3233004 RepID=UPI003F96C99F
MANRYTNLQGNQRISDSYTEINEGFDGVQGDLDTHTGANAAHGSTSAAAASRIMQRDASGRAKVAAPAASDDIARKAEVDSAITTAATDATTKTNAVQSNLTTHSGNAAIHTTQAEKDKLAGIATGAGGAGSATDTVVGTRTADPNTATAYGLTGTVTQIWSWIAKYFKAITGKANPFDTPDITLAATKSHVDDNVRHLTAEERTAWNNKVDKVSGKQLSTEDYTAAERSKLNGVATGAEVNQNAFAKVNNIEATGKTDTLTLTGGIGITVTTNPGTKTATITATGTTTPGAHGSSHNEGGSDSIPELITAKADIAALKAAQSEASTIPATIKRGLNVVNTTQASPAEFKVLGCTLVNLLGKDGGCESLTPFALSGSVELNSTQKRSGNSSIKINSSNSIANIQKDYPFRLDATKCYVFGMWVYVESWTNGALNLTIRDFATTNVRYQANFNTSVIGSWQFVYGKIPIANTVVGEGFRMRVGVASAATNVYYADEIFLYEVTAADYAKIDIDLEYTGDKLAEKFPYVDSVKHLQGAAVRKIGKNMLAGIPDIVHSNAVVNAPYQLTLTGTGGSDLSTKVMGSTSYRLSLNVGTSLRRVWIQQFDNFGTKTVSSDIPILDTASFVNFTTHANTTNLKIIFTSNGAGTFLFSDWQLEIGSVATPFTTRNDDYVNFPMLASNIDRSIADSYDTATGRTFRRWKTGVLLNGSLAWIIGTVYTGYKSVYFLHSVLPGVSPNSININVAKHNGQILFPSLGFSSGDQAYFGPGGFNLAVFNADSGWGESYVPSTSEIKAYFNGWRMNDGNVETPYNGTGTKSWTPIVTLNAKFVGKITSSTVANPHIVKRTPGGNSGTNSSLLAPSNSNFVELSQGQYNSIMTLNAAVFDLPNTGNGNISQTLFSFDLIEHVIRNYGVGVFGSAVSIADRVAWLKVNVTKFICRWHGFGSVPSGNKAYFTGWRQSVSAWNASPQTHTNGTVASLSFSTSDFTTYSPDANGFVHFLAYTDASNGTIASTINTDFVELEVVLNVTTLPTTGYATLSYTPYTLDYVLSQGFEEPFEGDTGAIALQAGGNQLELIEGVIVREKVTPRVGSGTAFINRIQYTESLLKNRSAQIIQIYKNGDPDNKWTRVYDADAYGFVRASVPTTDYDPTAEYTVTYQVLDKYLYSSNVIDTTVTYQSTLGGAVSKNTQDIADIKTQNGVQDWKLLLDEAYALNTRYDLNAHIGSRGTAHGVATITEAGFFDVPDKVKLDGIATGAGGAGSATDIVIGMRTINDTIVVGTTDTDTPTNLFSKIGAMIRAITGKADWFTPPTKSLEALNTDKVDKVAGKQLSTEDYTSADKTKLDGLPSSIGYVLGTYTGDGAASRDIALPFLASYVMVFARAAAPTIEQVANHMASSSYQATSIAGGSPLTVPLSTMKFVVSYNAGSGAPKTNESGKVYFYIAYR